jgi:hypothetical protein
MDLSGSIQVIGKGGGRGKIALYRSDEDEGGTLIIYCLRRQALDVFAAEVLRIKEATCQK